MTSPVPDGGEFTELRDATIPRVDLVDKAANGLKFLIAKRENGAGLMDPTFVRDLIGKAAEPEPAQGETVTMTGSPGAIAKMIHEAALRQTTPATVTVDIKGSPLVSDQDVNRLIERIGKAEMSTKNVNDLPDSDFAYIEPGGKTDGEGKTTPRSLRHFPINDEAHVRNALARAPQSPFGDKAMPKIRAAAKKLGIEVAKEAHEMDDDALDAMTALAEPDTHAPGLPTDPGSPAWEAVDAATARKWTAILARAKNAIDMLAEREILEAAAGDEGDAENACDLQDACCAIDYAISVLAPFAVDEQAEADCCDDMAAVGKALAGFDAAPLDTIEALATVTKAGRVLSSANEAAIRGAVESLQKVLASLPAAPIEKEAAQSVADDKETDMPEPATSAETTAEHGQEPEMGVVKADGDKPEMVAVYDKKGNLVGIVDPGKITRIAGAESDDEDEPQDDAPSDDSSTDATTETTDLTPAPAAEVGTPADAVPPDDEAVTKSTNDTNPDLSEMFKSSLLAAVEEALAKHSAGQTAQITKTGDAVIELAELVETLKGRIGVLEEQPAQPKVFTNGATPPAAVLRGQDRAAAPVDTTRAQELKKNLYRGPDAAGQNAIHAEMNEMAIAKLREIHQRRG
jgi:hypothetical protein